MAYSIIELFEYSDKSIAVFGDTKEIKQKLKLLGGRYNKNLTHPEIVTSENGEYRSHR